MTTKLMEEILSKENLEKASKAVIANKGSAGVDRMTVNELWKFVDLHSVDSGRTFVRNHCFHRSLKVLLT